MLRARLSCRAIGLVWTLASSAAAQSAVIAGRITDSATATPIGSATIRAVAVGGASGVAISGDDGTYRIAGLTAGVYALDVRRIGYRPFHIAAVRVESGMAAVNATLVEAVTELNPIVTTTSRGAVAQKMLDAPASIAVVGADQLANRPAPLVTDYLRTLPGVSVLSGGLAQANVVTRGFNNAFSTLLLGLQDYRFTGLPSLKGNLPFLYTATNEDIERIEVLNGPAAALYGPNAANGVLHVITKSPFDAPGTTITVDGGSSFTRQGRVTPGEQYRLGGRTAHVFGSRQNWGFKASGEYFSGTDWPDADKNLPAVFPSTAPPERAGRPIRRNTNVSRFAGEARLDWRSDDRGIENTLTAGYTKILHSNELTTTFGPTEGRNWTYTSIQDRVKIGRFFAQAFYNGSNSGNASPTDPSGSFYLTTGIPIVDNSRVFVGQVQQGFDALGAQFVGGVDYVHTEPRSAGSLYGRYETTSQFGGTTIDERGVYLQGTRDLGPHWDLVGAVRGDQTTTLAGSQFSPRLALVWKPGPTHTVRATFGRAFNSPIGYEYFLDQLVNPQQAPGFALRAIGNPAKTGWHFNRACDVSVNLGLCMHSPWVPNGSAAMASSAALAFPGFIAALPSIVNALPTLSAANKAALTGLLTQLNPVLSALRPTPSQVGTYLFGSAPVAAAAVTDLAPRRASFNNTFELGYKGIISDRIRIALDLWHQVRGDVGSPIALANPLVMYDPVSLGTYLATGITQGLVAAGQSQASAQATAAAAAQALVPLMAAFPQGTLAFTSPLNNDPSMIVTYTNGAGQVEVSGLDLAADWQPTDRWFLSGTYSYQDKIVFPAIGGAANPLMSNSPRHRASATARFGDLARYAVESTIRYADTFPVNSGYYNTLTPNVFNAAFKTYPPVPTQIQVDIGASYAFAGRGITVSLDVSNLLNNAVPNFAGTPAIGRLVLSRVRYEF